MITLCLLGIHRYKILTIKTTIYKKLCKKECIKCGKILLTSESLIK